MALRDRVLLPEDTFEDEDLADEDAATDDAWAVDLEVCAAGETAGGKSNRIACPSGGAIRSSHGLQHELVDRVSNDCRLHKMRAACVRIAYCLCMEVEWIYCVRVHDGLMENGTDGRMVMSASLLRSSLSITKPT